AAALANVSFVRFSSRNSSEVATAPLGRLPRRRRQRRRAACVPNVGRDGKFRTVHRPGTSGPSSVTNTLAGRVRFRRRSAIVLQRPSTPCEAGHRAGASQKPVLVKSVPVRLIVDSSTFLHVSIMAKER